MSEQFHVANSTMGHSSFHHSSNLLHYYRPGHIVFMCLLLLACLDIALGLAVLQNTPTDAPPDVPQQTDTSVRRRPFMLGAKMKGKSKNQVEADAKASHNPTEPSVVVADWRERGAEGVQWRFPGAATEKSGGSIRGRKVGLNVGNAKIKLGAQSGTVGSGGGAAVVEVGGARKKSGKKAGEMWSVCARFDCEKVERMGEL
ncbi:hypothetical protein D9611_010322 [Ephemerocybe angulata]|uniref:Uncharacterized protein n=1 Tax=Ephemerocybe angulata TaxID=980116 RepID=A0A8H5BBA1_9AGAR|nr:hypothetical protein D9611_010322 [Tulosesus angulatus]